MRPILGQGALSESRENAITKSRNHEITKSRKAESVGSDSPRSQAPAWERKTEKLRFSVRTGTRSRASRLAFTSRSLGTRCGCNALRVFFIFFGLSPIRVFVIAFLPEAILLHCQAARP